MSRSIVILSNLVDKAFGEQYQDLEINIFNKIVDLQKHIKTSKLRADRIFITSEVLKPRVEISLIEIIEAFENSLLEAEEVEFIFKKDDPEVTTLRFIINTQSLVNWNISFGIMSKDFISSYINNKLKVNELMPTYNEALSLTHKTEENLNGMTLENYAPSICKQINIAGLPFRERTVFSFITAQYLSLEGKTIIVEKDFDFLTLTYLAKQSGVDYLEILVEDIYENFQREIKKIKHTDKKLIVVGTRQRVNKSYWFICSLLYYNLSGCLKYIVKENNLEEISRLSSYVVILPNNIVDILKTTTMLPRGYEAKAKFAAVNMLNIKELTIRNSSQLEIIVRDVLQLKNKIEIPVYNISSLRLGGEVHNLHMLIKG